MPANAHASTKHFFAAPRVKVLANRELRLPADGGSTRHIEVRPSPPPSGKRRPKDPYRM